MSSPTLPSIVIHTVVLMVPDGEHVEDPNTLFEFAAILDKSVIPNTTKISSSKTPHLGRRREQPGPWRGLEDVHFWHQ